MEKKSCRCRLFSCFACFSEETTPSGTQRDPSEISNVDPCYVTSTAAPIATDDALTHPRHGPQPIVPPAALTPSEAITSTDVQRKLNHTQRSVRTDPSSSSQPSTSPDKVYQVGSSSSNSTTKNHNVADDQLQGVPSSSSVSKTSDLINIILTAANAVNTENVDADLDELIDYISNLLKLIKEKVKTGKKSSKTEGDKGYWQCRSEGLKKFRKVLSEGINVFKDSIPGEVKTVFQGLLKGMGTAHLATTGLLMVALILVALILERSETVSANRDECMSVLDVALILVALTLERFETVSANRDECMSVLGKICELAQHVNKLKQQPGLRGGMKASIKEAMGLIVEASIMCSTQIGSSIGWRFLLASENKEKLVNFQQKLERMYRHVDSEMSVCLYDAILCRQVRPQNPLERLYPDYAVGIEKSVEEVEKLLQWESKENAVAVVLHGVGGMGKTTLADAVFARSDIEGCKYSMVRLFDDVTSTPSSSDIVKLQTCILKDLNVGTLEETKHIRTPDEGRLEIGRILEKEKAFIYVDNVLQRYPFEQLLPKDIHKAKKLRMLITTRDTDASRVSRKLKTEIYPVKGLPHEEAKTLLKKEMYSQTDNMEEQLSSSQLDHIVEMCGYIPKLLEVVASFIGAAEDKQRAYRTVKEDRENNWKGDIGKDIARYVFAYENLDERLKDPFLDICSFYKGWDWSKVADIVGNEELSNLKRRALVTEGADMTLKVHDVILAMGLQQTEGTRFTSASEIKEFLDQKDYKDVRNIKGIMLLNGDKYPLSISASKLDLMCSSLRVFEVGNFAKVDGKCAMIFEKLVYLVTKISDLPFDVSRSKKLKYLDWVPKNLNLLQMPSSLIHMEYDGECLNSFDFQITSQCLHQLRNLRVLTLTRFARLENLPEELGYVINDLQELTLSECQALKDIPRSISKLQCLRILKIYDCPSLRQLPNDFGSLNSLQKLHLTGCGSLEALPTSFGKLSFLQELKLDGCTSLEVLPSSLEKLSSLRQLDLCRCASLKYLPCDLGKLTSLVKLDLTGCGELSSIPESIGQLKLLNSSMDLSHLRGLKELPDGFCKLSFITNLLIDYCGCLEKLPDPFGELKSLRKLSMFDCVRLRKLPESFGQLKYLEHLNLSRCRNLEELCVDFTYLSSLRVLSLDSCELLKKLPEDFHCLTSMEVLRLRGCPMLEGKWMDSMVKMKALQIVNITGSPMLERRWEEIIKQGDQSWSFAVYTGQGSANEEYKEHILKQLQSNFDSILTTRRGEPFRISDLPLETPLLVIFDRKQEFEHCFTFSLIEENIDDIEITHLGMIYFGNHFNKLPNKIMDRILGHGPANSNAQALFQQVFAEIEQVSAETDATTVDFLLNNRFEMSVKIVRDEKGDKYHSCWERLSVESLEQFVIKKCGRYLKLKHLVEKPRESNVELLRELFASGEEESTHGFLKNDALGKVRVDELEGKTTLLDIRPAKMCNNIPLRALMEMYVAEKERLNIEIITIPIIQDNTKLDVCEQFSRQVPWLVLQNPWQLTSAIKLFLVEECASEGGECASEGGEWLPVGSYPIVIRVIETNGTIAAHSPAILRMVNTWGAKAYPFTKEKSAELKEEERNQMKAMSNLMFLFHHLERVSLQVKEGMFKQKMICLYSSERGFTSSIRNTLKEFSDSFHIIYIPQLGRERRVEWAQFTEGIVTSYYPLESLKLPEDKMQGVSFLRLSEYEAMRFWERIYSLKECISEMDDNDKEGDGIQKFIGYIDHEFSWIAIIGEDGELVTTKEKEIVELFCKNKPKDKAKYLMQQLMESRPK